MIWKAKRTYVIFIAISLYPLSLSTAAIFLFSLVNVEPDTYMKIPSEMRISFCPRLLLLMNQVSKRRELQDTVPGTSKPKNFRSRTQVIILFLIFGVNINFKNSTLQSWCLLPLGTNYNRNSKCDILSFCHMLLNRGSYRRKFGPKTDPSQK